jgi:hypothetical protein
MKSHILLVAFAVLWVFGCGGPQESASPSSTPEQPQETKPSGVAQGTIAQNETVMNVKDAFAAWGFGFNDENVLSVYFFPTLLSNDERARMASKEPGSNPFHVMMGKERPADLQWYPHIELEITFKPDEPRNSEDITKVFLAINKIEDTGTYSIPLVSSFGGDNPTSVDGHEKLETVFSGDGTLDMVFKGGTTARSKFAWDVELKDLPVVE